MMVLFLSVLTVIYIAIGLLASRKYYARESVEWEKRMLQCCRNRKVHALMHDERIVIFGVTGALVLLWPLAAPALIITKMAKGLAYFYRSPAEKFIDQQEEYQRNLEQAEKMLKTAPPQESQIWETTIDLLKEKII